MWNISEKNTGRYHFIFKIHLYFLLIKDFESTACKRINKFYKKKKLEQAESTHKHTDIKLPPTQYCRFLLQIIQQIR